MNHAWKCLSRNVFFVEKCFCYLLFLLKRSLIQQANVCHIDVEYRCIIQNSFVIPYVRIRLYTFHLDVVHFRTSSHGIVSAETKINTMKSFEKGERRGQRERERERERGGERGKEREKA